MSILSASTSEIIFTAGGRETYTLITQPVALHISPSEKSRQAALVLLEDAKAGRPLDRSAMIESLATRAVRNRGKKPRSANAWAEQIAADITTPND